MKYEIQAAILEIASKVYGIPLHNIKEERAYWTRKIVERLGSNLPDVLAEKLEEKGFSLTNPATT